MDIKFTPEQAIYLLAKKWGYTVEKESHTFKHNVYHDDAEYYDMDVYKVYDENGKLVPVMYKDGPGEFFFSDLGSIDGATLYQHVNYVFEKEVSDRMFKLLMNE